jgi:hypothetical protein
MQFRPFLKNGVAVQVVGRLNERLKAIRPAGIETFDSAQTYFERRRKASFLAAGATSPYKLRAEFQVGTAKGVQSGRYEDTWLNANEWKREAWFGSSHLVKSQSGEKYYVLAEGPPVLEKRESFSIADSMIRGRFPLVCVGGCSGMNLVSVAAGMRASCCRMAVLGEC